LTSILRGETDLTFLLRGYQGIGESGEKYRGDIFEAISDWICSAGGRTPLNVDYSDHLAGLGVDGLFKPQNPRDIPSVLVRSKVVQNVDKGFLDFVPPQDRPSIDSRLEKPFSL
jgi:hypothetical protein